MDEPRPGRFAREIVVDRDEHGAPRITIDGQVLPWATAGIVPVAPGLERMAALTVTIPAARVVLSDELPDKP